MGDDIVFFFFFPASWESRNAKTNTHFHFVPLTFFL